MDDPLAALLADDDPILRPSPFPYCATAVLLHHLTAGGTRG